MNKKRGKYIFLCIIGIIVILLAINWSDIKLLINMVSKKSSNENIAEKSEENLNELKNPLLNIINEEDIESSNMDKISNEENNIKRDENKTTSPNTTEKKDDDLYKEIIAKYNSKLEALQMEFEGQLDAMIKEGYNDYKKGNISKIKLANKYISSSKALEKECDANFNQVLKQMEQELKDNNFDTSITKQVNSYYKNYKEKKKMNILAKAS